MYYVIGASVSSLHRVATTLYVGLTDGSGEVPDSLQVWFLRGREVHEEIHVQRMVPGRLHCQSKRLGPTYTCMYM